MCFLLPFLDCVFSPCAQVESLFFPLFCLCNLSSHYIGDCVCCGLMDVGWLLISPLVSWVFLCPRWEFGFSFGLGLCKIAIVIIVSLGCWCTLVLGCCWVVLATLGPRTTLSCLVDLNCVSILVGIVIRLSFPSSQSCEWIVLLRYAVVGLRTVESGIRGWLFLRRLVLRPPA